MELELGLRVTRDIGNILTFTSIETESAFVLLAHLPGFKKDEIEISINEVGTEISISGRRGRSSLEAEILRRVVFIEDVATGRFRKVFRIPDGVVLDWIQASFDEDDEEFLLIFMPKLTRGEISGIVIEEIEEEEASQGDRNGEFELESTEMGMEMPEEKGEDKEEEEGSSMETPDRSPATQEKEEEAEVEAEEEEEESISLDWEGDRDGELELESTGMDIAMPEEKQEDEEIEEERSSMEVPDWPVIPRGIVIDEIEEKEAEEEEEEEEDEAEEVEKDEAAAAEEATTKSLDREGDQDEEFKLESPKAGTEMPERKQEEEIEEEGYSMEVPDRPPTPQVSAIAEIKEEQDTEEAEVEAEEVEKDEAATTEEEATTESLDREGDQDEEFELESPKAGTEMPEKKQEEEIEEEGYSMEVPDRPPTPQVSAIAEIKEEQETEAEVEAEEVEKDEATTTTESLDREGGQDEEFELESPKARTEMPEKKQEEEIKDEGYSMAVADRPPTPQVSAIAEIKEEQDTEAEVEPEEVQKDEATTTTESLDREGGQDEEFQLESPKVGIEMLEKKQEEEIEEEGYSMEVADMPPTPQVSAIAEIKEEQDTKAKVEAEEVEKDEAATTPESLDREGDQDEEFEHESPKAGTEMPEKKQEEEIEDDGYSMEVPDRPPTPQVSAIAEIKEEHDTKAEVEAEEVEKDEATTKEEATTESLDREGDQDEEFELESPKARIEMTERKHEEEIEEEGYSMEVPGRPSTPQVSAIAEIKEEQDTKEKEVENDEAATTTKSLDREGGQDEEFELESPKAGTEMPEKKQEEEIEEDRYSMEVADWLPTPRVSAIAEIKEQDTEEEAEAEEVEKDEAATEEATPESLDKEGDQDEEFELESPKEGTEMPEKKQEEEIEEDGYSMEVPDRPPTPQVSAIAEIKEEQDTEAEEIEKDEATTTTKSLDREGGQDEEFELESPKAGTEMPEKKQAEEIEEEGYSMEVADRPPTPQVSAIAEIKEEQDTEAEEVEKDEVATEEATPESLDREGDQDEEFELESPKARTEMPEKKQEEEIEEEGYSMEVPDRPPTPQVSAIVEIKEEHVTKAEVEAEEVEKDEATTEEEATTESLDREGYQDEEFELETPKARIEMAERKIEEEIGEEGYSMEVPDSPSTPQVSAIAEIKEQDTKAEVEAEEVEKDEAATTTESLDREGGQDEEFELESPKAGPEMPEKKREEEIEDEGYSMEVADWPPTPRVSAIAEIKEVQDTEAEVEAEEVEKDEAATEEATPESLDREGDQDEEFELESPKAGTEMAENKQEEEIEEEGYSMEVTDRPPTPQVSASAEIKEEQDTEAEVEAEEVEKDEAAAEEEATTKSLDRDEDQDEEFELESPKARIEIAERKQEEEIEEEGYSMVVPDRPSTPQVSAIVEIKEEQDTKAEVEAEEVEKDEAATEEEAITKSLDREGDQDEEFELESPKAGTEMPEKKQEVIEEEGYSMEVADRPPTPQVRAIAEIKEEQDTEAEVEAEEVEKDEAATEEARPESLDRDGDQDEVFEVESPKAGTEMPEKKQEEEIEEEGYSMEVPDRPPTLQVSAIAEIKEEHDTKAEVEAEEVEKDVATTEEEATTESLDREGDQDEEFELESPKARIEMAEKKQEEEIEEEGYSMEVPDRPSTPQVIAITKIKEEQDTKAEVEAEEVEKDEAATTTKSLDREGGQDEEFELESPKAGTEMPEKRPEEEIKEEGYSMEVADWLPTPRVSAIAEIKEQDTEAEVEAEEVEKDEAATEEATPESLDREGDQDEEFELESPEAGTEMPEKKQEDEIEEEGYSMEVPDRPPTPQVSVIAEIKEEHDTKAEVEEEEVEKDEAATDEEATTESLDRDEDQDEEFELESPKARIEMAERKQEEVIGEEGYSMEVPDRPSTPQVSAIAEIREEHDTKAEVEAEEVEKDEAAAEEEATTKSLDREGDQDEEFELESPKVGTEMPEKKQEEEIEDDGYSMEVPDRPPTPQPSAIVEIKEEQDTETEEEAETPLDWDKEKTLEPEKLPQAPQGDLDGKPKLEPAEIEMEMLEKREEDIEQEGLSDEELDRPRTPLERDEEPTKTRERQEQEVQEHENPAMDILDHSTEIHDWAPEIQQAVETPKSGHKPPKDKGILKRAPEGRPKADEELHISEEQEIQKYDTEILDWAPEIRQSIETPKLGQKLPEDKEMLKRAPEETPKADKEFHLSEEQETKEHESYDAGIPYWGPQILQSIETPEPDQNLPKETPKSDKKLHLSEEKEAQKQENLDAEIPDPSAQVPQSMETPEPSQKLTKEISERAPENLQSITTPEQDKELHNSQEQEAQQHESPTSELPVRTPEILQSFGIPEPDQNLQRYEEQEAKEHEASPSLEKPIRVPDTLQLMETPELEQQNLRGYVEQEAQECEGSIEEVPNRVPETLGAVGEHDRYLETLEKDLETLGPVPEGGELYEEEKKEEEEEGSDLKPWLGGRGEGRRREKKRGLGKGKPLPLCTPCVLGGSSVIFSLVVLVIHLLRNKRCRGGDHPPVSERVWCLPGSGG